MIGSLYSDSLNAAIAFYAPSDPNYSPSAIAVETLPDAARQQSKIALADKKATDQIQKREPMRDADKTCRVA